MINRGVMLKALIEMWPTTLMCGALLFGVEAVVAYVIPTFQGQFSEALMQIEFIRTFVGAMLGVDVSDQLGPEVFMALPWVHPVVLSLVWAHALLCSTQSPVGEIDRGTADVTMTLPVSRWGIMVSQSVVWLAGGLIILALGLLGNLWGVQYVEPALRPDFAHTLVVLANLLCLYLAVGGLSWLASAAGDRRGTAMVVVFVVLLASFLLNFLAQFWEVAERVSFLGVMHYYRPLYVLRDGTVPWGDIGVLLGIGGSLWIAACVVFSRRDVCTV